jgi:ABC-type Zn2+ transport system substrate-binding protein/surface adhesin
MVSKEPALEEEDYEEEDDEEGHGEDNDKGQKDTSTDDDHDGEYVPRNPVSITVAIVWCSVLTC